MIISYYEDSLLIRDKKNDIYLYDVKNNNISKQQNKNENHQKSNQDILLEICALLYRNNILNEFKKKGIDFRTNNFYETVCDVLFEYEEESEEYRLLNNFIILAADYQIT